MCRAITQGFKCLIQSNICLEMNRRASRVIEHEKNIGTTEAVNALF